MAAELEVIELQPVPTETTEWFLSILRSNGWNLMGAWETKDEAVEAASAYLARGRNCKIEQKLVPTAKEH